jgi:hypothetical protein
MKKILIVSFYELKDYLLYIKELFEQYNFTVISYPLFRYAYDSNDKLDNYKEHMNDFIKENNPDIILWWFIDVPVEVFKYIKQNFKEKLFIMYNSDDPINLTKELFDKAKIFDIVITPCKETIHMYKLYSGCKVIMFGPMGYDPNLFKEITDTKDFQSEYDEFNCDISMLFYNMFLDKSYYPTQVVYKKDLIDTVVTYCTKNGIKLKLYGTPAIKEFFPQYYCGEVPYYKLNFLFNFSKINIISSPYREKSLLINEYMFSILGSGGLLMLDKTKDIETYLTNNQNCIMYDGRDFLAKINTILNNYNNYGNVKKKGLEFAKSNTWDMWVENLVKEIGKLTFDKKLYAELYGLDINKDLLAHWLNEGIKKKEICYDFDVPDNFSHEDYIANSKIKDHPKFAYMHWFMNSKSSSYLKKSGKNNINFVPSNYGIVMEDLYSVGKILNEITKYNTRDQGLKDLNNFCEKIPYIKINEIVDYYIKTVF